MEAIPHAEYTAYIIFDIANCKDHYNSREDFCRAWTSGLFNPVS